MPGPLLTTGWLREALGDPGVRVVDCRFVLGEPGVAERLYRDGHIPGASFLDVDRDLAGPPGRRGRHPLPAASDFEAAARRAGISPDSLVVAYDESCEGGAARLWWLLRHFGHESAAVLDGGLRAWREEGGPLESGEEDIEPGDFSPGEQSAPEPPDTAELAAEGAAGRLLLDARAPERFRGEAEPIDRVAGRIPGARNLPFAELAPGGRFLPPDELRARFGALGVQPGDEVVAYCGSGVTACVLVLAAELAGTGPVRLYPGSWSEWSGRGRPVERG